MKLPWTKNPVEAPTRPTDRRWAPGWCTVCRSPHPPLIYFQNGKNYCTRCAAKVNAVMGIRSAGRRATDVQFP